MGVQIMRIAVIENGVVVNVIIANQISGANEVECPDTVGIGWLYDGSTFTPPVSTIPPEQLPLDQDILNAALAQRGSMFRALSIMMFKEINKLRVKDGDPAYTLAQFKTAFENEMNP